MRFKKILAGTVAAALAIVSLPQTIGAAEDDTLSWDITAKSAAPIKVSSGSSGDIFKPKEIKFKLDGFEMEITPEKQIILLYEADEYGGNGQIYTRTDWGYADIKGPDSNGIYSFQCSVPESMQTEDCRVAAFLPDGNWTAELKVDLLSNEVQTFTRKNSQPVKIISDLPEGAVESSYYGGISVLGQKILYDWFSMDQLKYDTVYLPAGHEYTFITGVDIATLSGKKIGCRNADAFFVKEGENTYTVQFVVPEKYITLNLDTSALTASPTQFTSALNSERSFECNVYTYPADNTVEIPEGYKSIWTNVNFRTADNTNHTLQYTFNNTGLKNGDTLHFGTEFKGSVYTRNNNAYNPGDKLTVWISDILDEYNNKVHANYWSTNANTDSLNATLTFANEENPDDVYEISTKIYQYVSNDITVTLPKEMKKGRYKLSIDTGYDSDALKWVLKAESNYYINVGVQDNSGTGSSNNQYTVMFNTEFDEAEIANSVTVVYDYTYYNNGEARTETGGRSWIDVKKDENGKYSFTFSPNVGNNPIDNISAFMIIGNKVAEAKISTSDLNSNKPVTFTLGNSRPVKLANSLPEKISNYSISIFAGHAYVFSANKYNLAETDEIRLPMRNDYSYYVTVYMDNGTSYTTPFKTFSVGENNNTVNMSADSVPDKFITVNLDASGLPGYKYISSRTRLSDSNFSDEDTYAATFYDEKLSIPAEYATSTVSVSFDNNGNNRIMYTLPTALSDGDKVTLGTNFTSSLNFSYNYSYTPGDTVYSELYDIKDQHGNSVSPYFYGKTLDVKVTLTNASDSSIVYSADTTVNGGFGNLNFTLPKDMKNGRYYVELSAKYSDKVGTEGGTGNPPADDPKPEAPTTTTTPATEPEVTTTTATTNPAPSPTEQLVDKDEKTGVELFADDGVLAEGVTLNVEMGKTNVSSRNHVYVLDISLVNEDGETVQPGGYVTIRIPVPEGFQGYDRYFIYYEDDDGNLTNMNAVFENGYVIFTTNHFSTYILSTEELVEDDTIPHTGVTLLCIPAVLAATGILISRKRK